MIPFSRPALLGDELKNILESLSSGKLSGDGPWTKKCQEFFTQRYGFKKCLLTNSCTAALDMCALLIGITSGDEVIIPSYTFVSSANAFVLRGARIVFADSSKENPNIGTANIESLVSPKTKAIVIVHYAGVACDMEEILRIASKYNLYVVEDAAQAIDSYYKGKPLGTLGHFGCFSFHETKNVHCGEGGLLVINDDDFFARAEIIREKGTNRSSFFRGEIDRYGWVDLGSSYLASDLTAAFLFGQLGRIREIQDRRIEIWERYRELLQPIAYNQTIKLPFIPEYSSNNAHIFYIVCADLYDRQNLIAHLKRKNIHAVFHYLSLHSSTFFKPLHDGRELNNSDFFSDSLLRLPLYYNLTKENQSEVVQQILEFYS